MLESAADFAPAPNDPTLNPDLKSWVESANDPTTDFPIQNLPIGRFLLPDDEDDAAPRLGVAIGNMVADIDMLVHANALGNEDSEEFEALHVAAHHGATDVLLASPKAMRLLRERLQRFLSEQTTGQQGRRLREKALHPIDDVDLEVPCDVANYTDFYASVHHATNVGSMFRPDNPLLPNYKHVPIGYHGRASSIVPSGMPIRRPKGQTAPEAPNTTPGFGPCKRLDYELEIGCVIAGGNTLGEPVSIDRAADFIAGLCLVNDWSARDMQAWEYQPLGPFLAKNFATQVSPWIVTRDALRPFACGGPARAEGDPAPLPYLTSPDRFGGFDLTVEVSLSSAAMREKDLHAVRLSRGSLRDMFWTFPQMIAHHTSNGCNLLPGDLLASGTISGPTPESRGCMLELTWGGPPHNGPDGKPLPRKPIKLPTGETRTFLEDGDEVTMTAFAERPGFRRIGLGRCTGTIEPCGTN